MSIGTGIFLSATLLAIVILFAVTKDRWNWKSITKWGLLAPIACVALLSSGIYLYSLWEGRPTPQVTFNEIRLGATSADVKFAMGEPTSMDGPDRWIYDVRTGAERQDVAVYLIQFKEGRIRYILYTASESQIVNPYLLGFTLGASYQDVEEKLGQPSHLTNSTDELDRMFSYDKLNVFFSFKKGRAIAYGMYQPADGPMKFRDEAAGSAPSK